MAPRGRGYSDSTKQRGVNLLDYFTLDVIRMLQKSNKNAGKRENRS